MIIARYLSTKILFSTLAVSIVLSLVVMSGRLARYISAAADGQLAISLIFPVVFFRMPQLLEIILPVSVLLGILMSMGELNDNNEMTVIKATGMSEGRIMAIGMCSALFVAFVVALFSFYVSPKGNAYVTQLVNAQGLKSELSQLSPNTFYELKNEGGTVYAGAVDSERRGMSDVFVFRPEPISGAIGSSRSSAPRQTIIYASHGYQEYRDEGGFYFVMEDGVQFEGLPGQHDFLVTEFERYSQRIEEPDDQVSALTTEQELRTVAQLIGQTDQESIAELHWRLSLPVSVLLMAAIAFPLSRSNPRQSRYYLLIPSLIMFLLYMVALNTGKEALANGEGNAFSDIWSVHLVVFVLTLVIYFWPAFRDRLRHAGNPE